MFGVGAWHLSKEKLEEFVEELREEGALNPEEGKQLVSEVMAEAEVKAKDLRRRVEEEVEKIMAAYQMKATPEEVEKLKADATDHVMREEEQGSSEEEPDF